ncbi:MAG: hypothetical protein D6781_04170 [Verrucomicrobia bacterium]|nr:MAG: hypothetical protein D6781_04170 [Verrucomicrobiota bacterium]
MLEAGERRSSSGFGLPCREDGWVTFAVPRPNRQVIRRFLIDGMLGDGGNTFLPKSGGWNQRET